MTKDRKLNVRIDKRDRHALSLLAARERLPVSAVIRRLVWAAAEAPGRVQPVEGGTRGNYDEHKSILAAHAKQGR